MACPRSLWFVIVLFRATRTRETLRRPAPGEGHSFAIFTKYVLRCHVIHYWVAQAHPLVPICFQFACGAHVQIAHLLRVEWGLAKGDRVVLAFNFGLRFFAVFLGCLRAGIIAVPVYPPNPAKLKKSLQKLQLVVTNCTPKMILVDPLVNKLRQMSNLVGMATGGSGWPKATYKCPDVKEETLDSAAYASSAGWRGGGSGGRPSTSASAKTLKSFDEPTITLEDVAFLQFTSGSTSDPKGVMLTFGNLGHNIGAIINYANTVRKTSRTRSKSGVEQPAEWFDSRCTPLSSPHLTCHAF